MNADLSLPVSPHRLTLTPASSIQPRAVKWLWEGRVPAGALSLLAGREAMGKSTVSAWFAAAVTKGTLPGAYFGQPASVAIVAGEDSWAYTIRPRLEAAGADLDRVFRLGVQAGDAGLSLPDDLEDVAALLPASGVALLVLDPLMSRLDSAIDSHKDADVRRALEPLATVADLTGAAVLGLIHVNKSNSADAVNAVMGSRAFTAVARSVLFAANDPNYETRRVLGLVKSNLGRLDVPTLSYRIDSATVGHDADGSPITTAIVLMLGTASTTVTEAVRASVTPTRTVVANAATWLRAELLNGPVPFKTIRNEGTTAGHSVDALKRAKDQLGVIVTTAPTFPRTTDWRLPQ